MNNDESVLTLLKSFLTKACFTVGLCTTAYWSVAKIHQTMYPQSTPSGASTSLRDKVEALSQNQNFGTVPAAQYQPLNTIQASAPAAMIAPPSMALQAAVTTATTAAEAEASASPSPAEAQLQAQEANEQLPVAQPFYPNPYGYQPERDTASEGDKKDSKLGGSDGDAAAAGQVMGQLITPTQHTYGGVNIAQNNTANVVSNLTSGDIQALLGTSIKASIPAQTFPVTARNPDGSATVNYSVSSTRWSLYEGLKTDATFTVRASSNAAPVNFDISFKIERNAGVELPVQFMFKPSDSNARSEVRNGQPVRIFTFKTSDQSVRVSSSNESFQQLVITLVVDMTPGAPKVIEGTLAFHRSAVKTNDTAWDPNAPVSTTWVTVDQLPFSMKLEKSQ